MKITSKKQKSKILWGIFMLTVVITLITIAASYSFEPESVLRFPLIFLLPVLPIIILLLHATWILGCLRGLGLIIISSLTGLIFEIIGVRHGTVFGGHYVYQMDSVMLWGVPFWVPAYWAVFIYIGYCITTSFLFWTNRNKPNKYEKNLFLLLLLILLDGLIIVAIDLFMDPLQVKAGNWTWLEGGLYFGVPIGNFVGWFRVAAIATGIFRVFEYLFPHKPSNFDKSIFMIPVLGYGALCLTFLAIALKFQLPKLALIGSCAMFPIVIINLMFFVNWKNKKPQ